MIPGLYGQTLADLFGTITTDADGRFVLRDIGRERVVSLIVEGPTVETLEINVMTRPGEPFQVPHYLHAPELGVLRYYGSEFAHVAAPCQPIEGVVRDADTGKPVTGLRVASSKRVGNPYHFVEATTDREGRFRLTGVAKKPGRRVMVLPHDTLPYPMYERGVGESPGLDPITLDWRLKRGVWVLGRVTDKATARPVRASIEYFVFADDPAVKAIPNFGLAYINNFFHTGADGSYRVVGLPGRGVIAARAPGDLYRMAVGADRLKGRAGGEMLSTYPYSCYPGNHHIVAEVNPPAGAEAVTRDLALDPGGTLRGTVLGPDGKPLAGALVKGLHDMEYWDNNPLPEATFIVLGLKPGGSRTLLFVHARAKAAGHVTVHAGQKEPVVVRMERAGTVTGRLVDADGQPRAGVVLRTANFKPNPGPDIGWLPLEATTDKDGRFRLEGFVPGLKYSLAVVEETYRYTGWVFEDLTLRAGQTRDLGDVKARATGD
jgi:hypothetical protein